MYRDQQRGDTAKQQSNVSMKSTAQPSSHDWNASDGAYSSVQASGSMTTRGYGQSMNTEQFRGQPVHTSAPCNGRTVSTVQYDVPLDSLSRPMERMNLQPLPLPVHRQQFNQPGHHYDVPPEQKQGANLPSSVLQSHLYTNVPSIPSQAPYRREESNSIQFTTNSQPYQGVSQPTDPNIRRYGLYNPFDILDDAKCSIDEMRMAVAVILRSHRRTNRGLRPSDQHVLVTERKLEDALLGICGSHDYLYVALDHDDIRTFLRRMQRDNLCTIASNGTIEIYLDPTATIPMPFRKIN